MTKKDRQIVFEKYGGRCAYCGCELQKGWHVDHLEPCRRLKKWVQAGWYDPSTNEYVGIYSARLATVWKQGYWKENGFANADANHIDNYMPSCPSCNINKHGDTIEQFRASIQGYLNSLNLRMVQYKMVKKYGLVEETGKPVLFFFEKYTKHDQQT